MNDNKKEITDKKSNDEQAYAPKTSKGQFLNSLGSNFLVPAAGGKPRSQPLKNRMN